MVHGPSAVVHLVLKNEFAPKVDSIFAWKDRALQRALCVKRLLSGDSPNSCTGYQEAWCLIVITDPWKERQEGLGILKDLMFPKMQLRGFCDGDSASLKTLPSKLIAVWRSQPIKYGLSLRGLLNRLGMIHIRRPNQTVCMSYVTLKVTFILHQNNGISLRGPHSICIGKPRNRLLVPIPCLEPIVRVLLGGPGLAISKHPSTLTGTRKSAVRLQAPFSNS